MTNNVGPDSKGIELSDCIHQNRSCINPFELIRKYECHDCGGVMICACDEARGKKFLPHQLSEGTRLDTQQRILVTLGFAKKICNECRGLPADAHPKAAIYGNASKIKRYYWRELAFREQDLFEQFGGNPERYLYEMGEPESDLYKRAKREALADIKRLHETTPKYVYSEESSEFIIKTFNVRVHDVHAEYVQDDEKKIKIRHDGELLTVEKYAECLYQSEGYHVLLLESMPFHVLFAVFTWLLIQHPSDPNVRICGFGERSAYEADGSKIPIWTQLPSDFGTPGYTLRREKSIESHFNQLRPDRNELLWFFDYWLPYSEGLRQYLWAHRQEHIIKARQLIEILEPNAIINIIRYLLTDYWGRYLGWPDLLGYNSSGVLFIEVKSSKDKLSDEQKGWIKGNSTELGFLFEIFKVHRIST